MLRLLITSPSLSLVPPPHPVPTQIGGLATDGGAHLPSAAQLYEQLAPLFVWDHAVAVSCWLLFYAIEAAAIIAILREHPDDNQAVSMGERRGLRRGCAADKGTGLGFGKFGLFARCGAEPQAFCSCCWAECRCLDTSRGVPGAGCGRRTGQQDPGTGEAPWYCPGRIRTIVVSCKRAHCLKEA